MREIDREIEEKDGQITSEKEEEIKEVIEALKAEMTDEELVELLRESAPSFKYIPPQSFGEIDEPS